MEKKELIRLDARLVGVISHAVFSAELANGHRFVVIAKRGDQAGSRELQLPAQVVVEMSPYDMSRGFLVEVPGDAAGEKL